MAKLRTTLSHVVRRSLLLLIACMVFTATALLPASQTAYAEGGAIGGGGDPGGGSGGGQSRNGWGWYNYSVNGNPSPAGFKNPPGGNWASVSQSCRNIGADRVIAFIFLNTYGSNAANGVVYQYKSGNQPVGYDNLSQHRSGGDWLPTATAQALFNSSFLDPYRGGYTWGQNVAWFCYSADPPPQGNFDLADCTRAAGWVFDRSRPGDSILAHIQVDDITRTGGPTNTYRPDVNAAYAAYGIVGNHGFDYDISTWVSGSGSHNVKVYTYNVNSAGTITGGPLLFGEKTVSGCLDYSLKPSISITSSKVAEADSVIEMQPRIDNTGPTDSGSATQWKLTSFRVAPSAPVPQLDKTPATVYNSDQPDPCIFYAGAGVSACGPAVFTSPNSTASSSGLNVPVPYKTFEQRTATVGDFAPGTKICYALSAQPRAEDSTQWVYSNPACVTIGKSPKVQIWGGDLQVGAIFAGSAVSANVKTGVVKKNGNTFGSWVEYGIFATGLVTGTGSGSAYAGAGLANAGKCNTSYLSFTNSGNSTCSPSTPIGNYANSSSIPDVAASFPTSASTPSIGPNDLLSQSSPSGVFKVDGGAISLRGGNIRKGRWVVINAPQATVTITDDIKYTEGQLLSVGDIPQVIIIANKIIINSNVTRVDAWLVANGANGIIETCNVNSLSYVLSGTDRLTANKCNLPLTVNGPVMAKQLWLRRTAGSGSGPASGDPAEVFNLRPDAYMWANLHASGNNRVQTVYSTELPPRL